MRRLLVILGFLTLMVNAASAAVAIRRDLPANLPLFSHTGNPDRVQHDFVFSLGTGLTPPIEVLAVMAIATVMASFTRGGGRLGALLLALSAGVTFTWVILEPYARNRMTQGNLDAVESTLILANLSLCALTVLMGIAVAFTTPSDRYR